MADSEAEADEKIRGATSKTGKNSLSRLNNSERAWVANAKLRASKLYDQTRAAARNPAAPPNEVADLSRRSARAYQDLRREWEEVAAGCKEKDRKEAYAQVEPRWREVEDIFHLIGVDTDNTPSGRTSQASGGSLEEGSVAATPGGAVGGEEEADAFVDALDVGSKTEQAAKFQSTFALEQKKASNYAQQHQAGAGYQQYTPPPLPQKPPAGPSVQQITEALVGQMKLMLQDYGNTLRQENQQQLHALREENRREIQALKNLHQEQRTRAASASTLRPTPPTLRQRSGSDSWDHPTLRRYVEDVPDYGQNEWENPYDGNDKDEPPSYYWNNFPYPFNKPPDADSEQVKSRSKLKGLVPKFSGEESEFQTWLSHYIPAVHQANCPVKWKATTLPECLDLTNERLKDLMEGAGATSGDYARTINQMVKMFSHPQGLLAAKMEALDPIKNVTKNNLRLMEKWLLRLENLCEAAKSMKRMSELRNTKLFEQNYSKMEWELGTSYLDWCRREKVPRDILTLTAWLGDVVQDARDDKRHRRAGQAEGVTTTVQEQGVFHTRREENTSHRFGHSGEPRRTPPPTRLSWAECPLDGGRHSLALCDNFKALTTRERRDKLAGWRRCFACLKPGHRARACRQGVVCSTCQKGHHHLLHENLEERQHRSQNRTTGTAASSEMALTATAGKNRVALQTVPVKLYNGSTMVKTNLMMDPGSTGSFMSRRMAEQLRATGVSIPTVVTGFDGKKTEGPVLVVDLQVAAADSTKKHWIQVQVTEDPVASYEPYDWTKVKHEIPKFKNIPLQPPVQGKPVDIMLGMDAPNLITSLIPDVGGDNTQQPVARLTRLGWVVGGPTRDNGPNEIRNTFTMFTHQLTGEVSTITGWQSYQLGQPNKSRDEEMHKMVDRLWEVDMSATSMSSTTDDHIFQRLAKDIKKVGNKYELGTLWKEGQPDIKNNYGYAERRFRALERSRKWKNEEIKGQYLEQMNQWKQEEYVEEVETKHPEKDKAYYLPHQPVVKWDKAAHQVRPVMDGAARAGTNKCLNDCLYKGPKLINELVEVLLRFRARRITLAADIKKMFYQIQMKEEDRDYHRFLWWDEQSNIKIYRWKVHPFGSAASPCVAIFTIKEHARRHRTEYPRAAETVIHSTLVDDNLDSVDTEEEAIALARQLEDLFHKAGMELSKFVSNSAAVLAAFPPEKQAKSIDVAQKCVDNNELPTVKALGVVYNCEEDHFSFVVEDPPTDTVWTKRNVLKYEAKLYDPHGLVMPHTIQARMLLQAVWKAGTGWDEEIPHQLLKEWKSWLDASKLLPHIKIPRHLGLTGEKGEQLEVHIFADASADAYAAAAYCVVKGKRATTSRLAISRARVAPKRTVSIPRLELMGATLALEMAHFLEQALKVPVRKMHFWSDSINVICWVKADSRVLNTFVGVRIANIQANTAHTQWRWTDTKQNPADIPSTGESAQKLKDNKLWFQGPPFIQQDQKHWPKQPSQVTPAEDTLKEIKKGAVFSFHVHQQPPQYKEDHYTPPGEQDRLELIQTRDWKKILHVVSWCRRWKTKERGPIQQHERNKAESIIIHKMQQRSFARSLEEVETRKRLHQGSPLIKLGPALDHNGLLRVAARMKQMNHINYDQRCQIIIPKEHPYTKALLWSTHRDLLHAGAQHILTTLMHKYWILRATGLARKTASECVACRRKRGRPARQTMADLPNFRMPAERPRPFQTTALDAAGPFYVVEKKKGEQTKVWMLLMTCATFRAVHLELLEDMSTATFLLAFDRFAARRGKPEKVISDNGSNFLGGENELRKQWDWNTVKNKKDEITWEFIPPLAPHFGGLHERMVASAKSALYHCITEQNPMTRDALHTALVVVESIINSRPLTYKHMEADGVLPLTPADFLGASPYRPLAAAPDDRPWDRRTQWRRLQQRLDELWRRFCLEMQPHMQKLAKERPPDRTVRVGEVVALIDEKRRGMWPLGKIEKTEVSHDGRIRKVQVRCRGTTYRRPIDKIVLLGAAEDAGIAEDAPPDEEEVQQGSTSALAD